MADYNQYPAALLKEFPDIKMGSGKSIRFQLCNVYVQKETGKLVVPTSANVLPVDRIIDPQTNDEFDIAYVTGNRPLGPNAMRATETVLGEIVFTRGNNGMFEWFGEPQSRELAKYLFFCNWNQSNHDKPWHKKPNEYIFKILDNTVAENTLSQAREIDKANAKIESIAANPQMMSSVKMAMFPNDYQRYSDEQIILKLRDIAMKDPKRILKLSGGSGQKIDLAIHRFVKNGKIMMNEAKGVWEYPDGSVIVTVSEEENQLKALKDFFATEPGVEALRILLETEDEPAKKTSGKKPVGNKK